MSWQKQLDADPKASQQREFDGKFKMMMVSILLVWKEKLC